MVRIAKELTNMGVRLEFIDLGGGLGIPYHHDTDPVLTPEDYAAKVIPVFLAGIKACGIQPELWGRAGPFAGCRLHHSPYPGQLNEVRPQAVCQR